MRFISTSVSLTGLALVMAVPLTASAATLCVEPTGAGGCYTTIQAAVTAAAAGDTVDVAPASYNEIVILPSGKDGVILSGDGAFLDGSDLGGDGLTILSNNVTVDGLTVRNSGGGGIVIGDGILIPTGTTLTNVTVTRTVSDCIFLFGADATSISGCSLISCGGSGIEGGLGPDFNGSSGLTVEKTTMRYNGEGGAMITGDLARFTGNTISDCALESGISVTGDNTVVEGNKVSRIDSVGIFVTGDGSVVQKNKITLAGSSGIYSDGANPTILKNKISLSGGVSISTDPCSGGSVIGNKISDTLEDSTGIFASCNNGPGGLLVEKNKVSRAMDDCFAIFGEGVTLNANKAVACGGDAGEAGFAIDADNSTVTGNLAKGAAESGFEIDGNDVTLSGNKAIGNYGPGYKVEGDATGVVLSTNSSTGNVGPGYAVYDSATSVTLTGNSSGDIVPYCKDDPGSTVIDGMGNSFSLAMPPVCPEPR